VMLFEHIPQFVFPAALAAAPALRNLRNLLSFVHIQVRCARSAMQCNAERVPAGTCRAVLRHAFRGSSLRGALCGRTPRGAVRYPPALIAAQPLSFAHSAFVHGNPLLCVLAPAHACMRGGCVVAGAAAPDGPVPCVCSPQACRRATTRSSSCAPLAAPSTLTRHTCFSTPTLPSALTSAPYPWSPTLAPQVPSSVPGYQGRALRGLYAG
jgi:hypothetical protein